MLAGNTHLSVTTPVGTVDTVSASGLKHLNCKVQSHLPTTQLFT